MAKKQQILMDSIIDGIRNGELVNGSFLPCERDLAEEYGFSRVTVRAALQMLVRGKVLQTVPNKGYKVVQIPTLPLPDSLNIGALWSSGMYSEYSYVLYDAAEVKAKENKYELFVRFSDDDVREQAFQISRLLEKKTDGLLIVPTYDPESGHMTLGNHRLLTLLRRAGIPLVVVDRDFPETDLPCVINDEYGGGRMVADLFADLGHKRAALLRPEYSYYVAHRRFGGFLDGCKEHGIETCVYALPGDPYLNNEKKWAIYKKNRSTFYEMLWKNNVSAVMVNQCGLCDLILKDMEESGLDIVLYDFNEDIPAKGNVWRVERPIEMISSSAAQMLFDEIRSGARNPVRRICLKPEIRKMMKEEK